MARLCLVLASSECNASGQKSIVRGCAQAAKDDSDDDISDDDSDDEEEGVPVLHLRQIQQSCGINRVRAMPQQSSIIATWGEDGRVQVKLSILTTSVSCLSSKFTIERARAIQSAISSLKPAQASGLLG